MSFTPTGMQKIRLPAVLARVGVLDLEGIATAPDGKVYLDQSGDYGPPVIVALRKGRVTTLWAADT